MPLDELLKRLARTIQTRFGYDEIRVYLHDRESGDLVEPRSRAVPGGTLALKSWSSAKTIYLNDLRREDEAQVVPWRSETRAAAAVPIQYRKAVIGTIEVQSSVINAFNPHALETIALLNTQMAANIENRWLLESGWLTQQIRECLRNLMDDVYLNHCALADWLQINDLARRSELLREILCDAIEHIIPESIASNSRTTRRYQILKQTFIDQLAADTICQNLSLSRRQYFYDLKQAIDVVVDYLYVERQQIKLQYDVPSTPN